MCFVGHQPPIESLACCLASRLNHSYVQVTPVPRPIVLIQVHCYFWSTTTSKPINCAWTKALTECRTAPRKSWWESVPFPTGRSCFGRQSLPSWGLCGTCGWGAIWEWEASKISEIPGSYHDPIDPFDGCFYGWVFFIYIFSWCRKHPSHHLNTMICFILFHREVPLRLLQLSIIHNFACITVT